MLPTHDVPCPHCGKALYSAVSLDDGFNPLTPESPKVEAEGSGFYMRCPHCAKRVQMERLTAEGREAFRLAGGANRRVNDSRP